MQIKRTGYKHDMLNVLFYFLLAIVLGFFTCSRVPEGYVSMVAIAIYAFHASLISLLIIFILKKIFKRVVFIEILYGMIPLVFFELTSIYSNDTAMFGFFDTEPVNFENPYLAMSLASLISVLIVYGRSVWIKTTQTKAQRSCVY